MQIAPIDRSWIHTYVMEPYLQGSEWVNQAWQGSAYSVERIPLSLKERVCLWVKGTLLLLPLINSIIWVAWKVFGKPERWSPTFSPESDPPLAPAPLVPVIFQKPEGEPRELERFGFDETVGGESFRSTWMVERFPDWTITTQNTPAVSCSAIYTADHKLKEMHSQRGQKRIDFILVDPSRIQVNVANGAQSKQDIVEIPQDGRPWLQQRSFDFKSFVLSEKSELEFYSIIPEYPAFLQWVPFLQKPPLAVLCKAVKLGEEEIPGLGKLLKVRIDPMRGFPYNTAQSELWFDPVTGALKKFIDSGRFIPTRLGIAAQNHQ